MLEGITYSVIEDKDEVKRFHSPAFQKEICRRMFIYARQQHIVGFHFIHYIMVLRLIINSKTTSP